MRHGLCCTHQAECEPARMVGKPDRLARVDLRGKETARQKGLSLGKGHLTGAQSEVIRVICCPGGRAIRGGQGLVLEGSA